MRKPKHTHHFFSSLLLLLHSISSLSDDSAVMADLSKSLTPPPSGWSSPSPSSTPCDWPGVKCDNTNQVTSIDLASQSLSGSLPPTLNQLKMLTTLSLQRNRLTGPLPPFANLSNIQEIYLDNNAFTSVPPSCFSGLSMLQKLSLSDNPDLAPWAFPQELVDSEGLVELDASNVSLFGALPDIFENFISLQSIRLSYNNLTGQLPISLSKIGVENLWVNNQVVGFSGTIDLLSAMDQLSQVWLHKNAFYGSIPDLSNCTNLFDLQLRDNQFTGIVPPSLTSLPGLLNVSLANNKLQGPFPEFGRGVKVTLGTTNNFCNSSPGPCDPQVTALLEIAGAMGFPMKIAQSWTGNDACQDWDFVTCDNEERNVTIINFSKQHFTGEISPGYAKLTSLSKVFLNDNNLTGTIPDSLTGLPTLQLLDVSNNNLTGKVPVFPLKVAVKTAGNVLLGTNTTTDKGRSPNIVSPGNSSEVGSSPTKQGGISAGVIAGIVIAIVVFIGIVCMVSYKLFMRKHQRKFGRVPLVNTTNGKELASNGSTSGGVNAHTGLRYELSSQNSDSSEAQFVQGGNIAISIQVLRQVTNNFSHENILGKGGFGIVYKGVLHDGTQIAVKRMESSIMSTKGLNEFQAEISVLTKVRHRHLVALLGFCANDNERLLVYEFMPQGTLGQHLFQWRNNGMSPLTWKQRVTIALDVARGVEYLHTLAQESFIHRDLKASNILLGDDMRAKVSDFGLVRTAPSGQQQSVVTRLAGTFGYLAPEYAVTGKVSTKVDVYAFGAVLMELITGRPALDETKSEEEAHLVTWFRRLMLSRDGIRKAIDPTLEYDDETMRSITKVIELAGHCTSREANQRPDMGHAVNILGPLVEQWTPTQEVQDDHPASSEFSLSEALERWQRGGASGSSTMNFAGVSFSDTFSSIPPNGLNTFQSSDGR